MPRRLARVDVRPRRAEIVGRGIDGSVRGRAPGVEEVKSPVDTADRPDRRQLIPLAWLLSARECTSAVNGDYAEVRDCVHLCEAGACGKQQPAPDDEERVNAFHASLSGRGDGFI